MKARSPIYVLTALAALLSVQTVYQIQASSPIAFGQIWGEHTAATIVFTGDIFLGRLTEGMIGEYGTDYPFLHTAEELKNGNYTVGNFESAIASIHARTPNYGFVFSTNPQHLVSLETARFTHLSLANNHSFDYGQTGYDNTVEVLSEFAVPFGSFQNNPEVSFTTLPVGTESVALVGINLVDASSVPEGMVAKIAAAESSHLMTVVYVHWGNEYDLRHSSRQEALAEELVASGADLIIGHHPHVTQDIGLLNGVPVLYSLGNFVFDQFFSSEVQTGLAIKLMIQGQEKRVKLMPVHSGMQPYWLNNEAKNKVLKAIAARSTDELAESILAGEIRF